MSTLSDLKQKFMALEAEVQGHIHAGLRCAPLHNKAWVKRYQKQLKDLQDARDMARSEWRKACESEGVIKPSRRERMIVAARGNEDLESTQAARRICNKNGWVW